MKLSPVPSFLQYLCVLCGLLWPIPCSTAHATTLPPEFKAYDFGEAYYIEDGGVVISPYDHGFYCPHGIQTPEGIHRHLHGVIGRLLVCHVEWSGANLITILFDQIVKAARIAGSRC